MGLQGCCLMGCRGEKKSGVVNICSSVIYYKENLSAFWYQCSTTDTRTLSLSDDGGSFNLRDGVAFFNGWLRQEKVVS